MICCRAEAPGLIDGAGRDLSRIERLGAAGCTSQTSAEVVAAGVAADVCLSGRRRFGGWWTHAPAREESGGGLKTGFKDSLLRCRQRESD